MPMNDPLQNFEKRYKPRYAVKYVFFDANTGSAVLEYGGFKKPLMIKNKAGKETPVYELGALVKEIREQ